MNDSIFDKTFRDSEGKITIAQPPNLTLIVWFSATLLKLLLNSGTIYSIVDTIAFGALFTWAWEELFQGVNYFRRGLGAIVLISTIFYRSI